MSNKALILKQFIKAYDLYPKQRSTEWYAAKGSFIGGSELAALMNYNPYSSYDNIIYNKGVKSTFVENEACWWGTVFESVITRYVEIDCNTTITGDNIWIPIKEVPFHANSPDGYCIFKFNDGNIVNNNYDSYDEKISVLEFKCPFRRRPKGEVPLHYLPQVWDEIAASPIVDMGCFIDGAFKKCSLNDLCLNGRYDFKYHTPTRNFPKRAIAWGMISVYAPFEMADIAEIYEQYTGHPPPIDYKTCSSDIIDLGDIDNNVFNYILKYMAKSASEGEGQFIVKTGEPSIDTNLESNIGKVDGDPWIVLSDPVEPPKGYYFLAVLPWKLFEIYYVPIARQEGFLDKIKPIISRAIDDINEIKNSPNPEDTWNNKYIKCIKNINKKNKQTSKQTSKQTTKISQEDLDFFKEIS